MWGAFWRRECLQAANCSVLINQCSMNKSERICLEKSCSFARRSPNQFWNFRALRSSNIAQLQAEKKRQIQEAVITQNQLTKTGAEFAREFN